MCPMCEAMTGPWGWAMMLLMGLFWIAVIGGVGWLLYRLLRGRGGGSSPDAEAKAILRDRYASGEIDRATFERMREDLDRDGAP